MSSVPCSEIDSVHEVSSTKGIGVYQSGRFMLLRVWVAFLNDCSLLERRP